MVQSLPTCLYCGLPLQRAAQFIGVADVILGVLNAIVLAIHAKEKSDGLKGRWLTFERLERIPVGVVIALLVCHVTQLLTGIILIVSAAFKNRGICRVWLGVTGATALFTGLLFRIYGMLIVNEFSNELKSDAGGTGYPGQDPNPKAAPLDPNAPVVYAADQQPQNSMTYTQAYPSAYGNTYGNAYGNAYGNTYGNNYGNYSTAAPTLQEVHVPMALQPNPQFNTAVGCAGPGDDRKRWG